MQTLSGPENEEIIYRLFEMVGDNEDIVSDLEIEFGIDITEWLSKIKVTAQPVDMKC